MNSTSRPGFVIRMASVFSVKLRGRFPLLPRRGLAIRMDVVQEYPVTPVMVLQ